MRLRCLDATLCFVMALALPAFSQDSVLNDVQRGRVVNILHETVNTVRSNYYDPKLRGIDLDSRMKTAEQKIGQATSYGAAFALVAWTLDVLEDSHTLFRPPPRPFRVDNGWMVRSIGDHCLITAVRPGSDAAAQGLKLGDELLGWNGIRVTPQLLSKLGYAFNTLAPHSSHDLVVASPGVQPRHVTVKTDSIRLPRVIENYNDYMSIVRKSELDEQASLLRWVEFGDDVYVYRLPGFFLTDGQINDLFDKARKHKTLILDLRDNPGGSEEVLTNMLGHVFDHEVKVADRIARKDRKPVVAKPRGHAFTGKLIVLVNSGSASASELFARVIQLEKRGIVLGDRSAGKVMEAEILPRREGSDTVMFYAVEVTIADLIMADGKSLEHNPVVPEELILPTAGDLSSGRDPVLARAANLAGVNLTPDKAGTLFPYIWRKL